MKKKIPLALHRIVQKLALSKKTKSLTTFSFDKQYIRFKDLDNGSSFCFLIDYLSLNSPNFGLQRTPAQINAHRIRQLQQQAIGKTEKTYVIYYSPKSEINISQHSIVLNINSIEKKFNEWINLLQAYNALIPVENFHEDPILDQYQEEIYQDFKILDADANFRPFSIKKQLLLNQYLDKVVETVKTHKTGNNAVIVDAIIKESKDLKTEIPRTPKNSVMKKISKILAKVWKMGIKIGRELFIDYATELTKKLLMG